MQYAITSYDFLGFPLRNHEKKRLEESITQVVLSSMLLIIKHLQPMYA